MPLLPGAASALPCSTNCAAPIPGGYVGPAELRMAPHEALLVPGTHADHLVLAEARQHLPYKQLRCRCLQYTWVLAEKMLPKLSASEGG